MLLSARFLTDVCNANSWRPVNQAQIYQGDTATLYLQILDMSVFLQTEGFNPPGRRYIPAAGSTLSVTLQSLDAAKQVVKTATQPFPLDGSIWSFNMLSTDQIQGTINLLLTLNQSGVITRGKVAAALAISCQANVI